MSFRGYYWHTVVLPEEDRFARADSVKNSCIHPSKLIEPKFNFSWKTILIRKEQVKVIKHIMASIFFRGFGG